MEAGRRSAYQTREFQAGVSRITEIIFPLSFSKFFESGKKGGIHKEVAPTSVVMH